MATVDSVRNAMSDPANESAKWNGFSRAELDTMLHDDLTAGASVSLELTAIIFAGLLIGLTGVLLSFTY